MFINCKKIFARLKLCVLLIVLVLPNAHSFRLRFREAWGAQPPLSVTSMGLAETVIIHHTLTGPCFQTHECKQMLRDLQSQHRESRKWDDIGYHFIITGDNYVNEGRGFGVMGLRENKPYDGETIDIAFMGNYQNEMPTTQMMRIAQELITHAVREGYLSKHYRLYGHRQRRLTNCPGGMLYNAIKKWPHWLNF